MEFEIDFEATGFTANRSLPEKEFDETDVVRFMDLAKAEGLLEGLGTVRAVTRVAVSEDDAQGETDIHVFVGVTLLVDVGSEAAAEAFVPPESLLNRIADQMAQEVPDCGLDLEVHSWEVVDVNPA